MTHSLRSRWPATAVVALAALAAGACAGSPPLPTAPSSVLSRGAVPQLGAPTAADPLPGPNALGATRFMAFGDSITFGETSSFDGGFLFDPVPGTQYPMQLDNLLEAAFPTQDFTVTNEGVSGEAAITAVSSGRFAQRMAAQRPQGLLLLEGINDLNGEISIPSVVNALAQMIDIARLYNTTVFISTMFQSCVSTRPDGSIRENAADQVVPFNTALRAMAAGRQNVYVVDMYAAFGNNCGPNGGVGLLGGDGLHPMPTGYSVMAGTFSTALRSVFAVRGSYQ
jgi:lysophospholipase L1-like esterase